MLVITQDDKNELDAAGPEGGVRDYVPRPLQGVEYVISRVKLIRMSGVVFMRAIEREISTGNVIATRYVHGDFTPHELVQMFDDGAVPFENQVSINPDDDRNDPDHAEVDVSFSVDDLTIPLSKLLPRPIFPLWQNVLPILIESASAGSAKTRLEARRQLERMAKAADRYSDICLQEMLKEGRDEQD